MKREKQIAETKSRLRDWWNDRTALGRPLVLCNRMIEGYAASSFDYFTYPRMMISMLGNDGLKPQLRAAQDAPYKAIPPLPKAPVGIKVDFKSPEIAPIMAQVANQVKMFAESAPYADSIPIIRSQAGAGFPGCCLGEYACLPTTGPGTIWYETVRRWEELETFSLDRSSPWWQIVLEITKRQLELAPEWVAVGFPSMAGTTDILQSLRGTQKLLRDMFVEKKRVKSALDQLNDIYNEVVKEFWSEIRKSREGSGSHIGIWGPGNTAGVQCDALAYLGPRQFNEFALPYIKRDLDLTDRGTYHLDGPGALKFVDDLLGIESLDLIQWVHGAGEPDGVSLKWHPLVKKVLQAGKRIMLFTDIDRVPQFMRRLKAERIDPCGVVFNIGNVHAFEIEEFLPWLEVESSKFQSQEWYGEEFWEDYEAMMREEEERYQDLFTEAEELQLDYKKK